MKLKKDMHLYQTSSGIVLLHEEKSCLIENHSWDQLVNRDDLYEFLLALAKALPLYEISGRLEDEALPPPIGRQEIWAAGVTYLRSKEARMKEAQDAGGGDFYDRVYDAPRPELFSKGNVQRAAGHRGQVRIRRDSTWDVPEPELTLFITSKGKIVGYTIGNDMSSRSIEGENPLYLPQAKVYDGCAGLGPCLYVPEKPISPDTQIHMQILRGNNIMYDDSVAINRMKRKHTELVEYLYRECSFPYGCYLMTGTCLVPPDDFTLQRGDEVRISIDAIGSLVNYVEG